jgi:hypothetical protein
MIKFLRKIRYDLMSENKSGKYFKYAIGEIILVVIGILIALQINNWNEATKNQNEELKLLQEMHNNLKNDLKDCIWNISKQEDLKASNLAVLNHLEEAIPINDTLKKHYGNLIYATTQRRNMAAYDHLRSRGIDLITDDSLRTHITVVYSERYYFIEKMELEYDNPYQLNTVIPQLNEKVILETSEQKGYPVDLQRLTSDAIFKGTLRMNIKIRTYMKQRYSGLKNDLEKLITHIDSELNQRL